MLVNIVVSRPELSMQRIVLVRALPGFGDMLCAVPALRALRAAFPQAHITLIGLPQARACVERFPQYLDNWLEFPGFPGLELEPQVERLPDFFHRMHGRRFDLALQMHGNGITSNLFTVMLGAKVTAGCFLPGQYCPDARYFLPYPEHEPEIWRLLRLVEFLGLPLQGDRLEFPLYERDWDDFSALAAHYDLKPGTYACIHPGASTHNRRWAMKHFVTVADALIKRGLRVVITGSANELPLTRTIARAMHAGQAIDLAGQTSLGSLAIVLKRAALLVCNDTGISHLAAALCVPSVVIFCGSDPARWAPLDRSLHRAVIAAGVWEQYVVPARPASTLPLSATPNTVLAQVDSLLKQEPAHAIA